MRKNLLFLGSTALAILLLGAGCDKKAGDLSGNQVTSKSAEEQAENITNVDEQKSGGFSLTVEQKENKAVYVKFNVPEDLKQNADGYRIVMAKDVNPTKENATYWYQLGKSYEDKLLTNMPIGIRHFRVCVTKVDQCTVYSNDIEVDIK